MMAALLIDKTDNMRSVPIGAIPLPVIDMSS